MTHQNKKYNPKDFNKEREEINIRVEIEKYLRYSKWFLLGIFIAISGAFLYLRYSTPSYIATSSILIKDNRKAGYSAEFKAFSDLGIVGGQSLNNVDNEVKVLKSRKIVGNVVDFLNLEVSYFVQGTVIQTEVYKEDSPIKIDFIQKDPLLINIDTTFNVKINDRSNYSLLDKEGEIISRHTFGELTSGALGVFKIIKNPDSKSVDIFDVTIRLVPKSSAVDSYRTRINISPFNENSSVLILTLQDPVKQKAEDVLNELIRQYNLDAINDKNLSSKKTLEFINKRIVTIGSELSIIDDSVEQYKSTKNFIGLQSESTVTLQSLKEMNSKVVEAKTQLSLVKWIEKKLKNEASHYEVLPVSLGVDNSPITGSIIIYNELIMKRNLTKENAGVRNPFLLQIESQIESGRSSLLRSISNMSKSLDLKLIELNKEYDKVLGKIKSIPSTERGYLDIARQQQIKAALYSYLLNKKQEIDLSLAVTVPNAKIIDSAYGDGPVSPNGRKTYIIALSLGLLLPFIIIYILNLLDTKIHNREDIESQLSIPFLGDIPKSERKSNVVIGNDDTRSTIAEAFRLIRTNLYFMLANNRKQSKSIFVTSTTNGEGKSFISINIAATLALSGKKVLLMGMDLRNPKVTEYLGASDKKGITDYIKDDKMTLEELIFTTPQARGLDIISSGVIPPNPAELLITKRVDNLFTITKQEYDIVIVDTSPVNLVTDTLLISKYADMFMYVVRANYLDKRLLTVPQELYNEKKLSNMAIVLNDTDIRRNYTYGYGGYGYGNVKKPWYKKYFGIAKFL